MKTLRLSLLFAGSFLAMQTMAQKALPGKKSMTQKYGCSSMMPQQKYETDMDTTKPSRSMWDVYYLWDAGTTLKVRFLSGSKSLQDKVKAAAKLWEQYANIKFEFVDYGDSHIRILLGTGKGHNSLIGTLNNIAPQDQQTMNLDTLDFYYQGKFVDVALTSTTVHEFGHALGFLHEHMNPTSGIKWNREAVYTELKKTNNWDRDKVDANMFQTYALMYTNGTKYDPKSIMHYPLSKTWTLDGYNVGWNVYLSEGDKEMARLSYPYGTRSSEFPRFTITNYTTTEVVNSPAKKGISIYPSFVINTAGRDGDVYFIAYILDQNGNMIPTKTDASKVVITYKGFRLAPGKKIGANKTSKDFELFIPYTELPAEGGTYQVMFVAKLIDGDEVKYLFNGKPVSFSLPKRK